MERSDYRLRQRDYLLRIARAMNSHLDLPAVLALVVRFAVNLTQGDAGVIILKRGSDRFRLVARYRLDDQHASALQPLLEHFPSTLPSVGNRGTALWRSGEMQAALRRLTRHLPPAYAQVIALPLVSDEEIIGVLFVFRSAGAALFTSLDTQLLEAFADQAAVAVQNADLYATLSSRADKLRRLYDFSLKIAGAGSVDTALDLTVDYSSRVEDSEWAAIFIYRSGDWSEIRRTQRSAAGLLLNEEDLAELARASERVLTKNAPLLLPQLLSNDDAPEVLQRMALHAAVALPVSGAEAPFGVLWVGSRQVEAYEMETTRLLATFAHYLGLALGKFNLLEQLGKRERQLSTIVENNPAGVLLLDAAARIATYNPPVAAMTGRSRPLTQGKRIDEVLRLEDENGQRLPIPLPEAQTTGSVQGYLLQPNGQRSGFVQVSVTALAGETAGGQPAIEGYVVNIVDLSAMKETEQAKSIFLAGLSHELKTPLSIIRGYAETLRYPQVHEDTNLYNESIDVILDETEHLTQMVDQMLLAARLQAGVLSLDLEPFEVGPLVRSVFETFRQAYPAFQWELQIQKPLPPVMADPGRLREVLHNLLSNAVKYSDPSSHIWVSVHTGPDVVSIGVRDEGIGISEEDQANLFQRFFRASDRAEGTGLGLYMSKAIIDAHGGSIEVESERDVGSLFTVRLPLSEPIVSKQQEERE